VDDWSEDYPTLPMHAWMEHATLVQLCIDFDISTTSVAFYFVSSSFAFTVRRVVPSRKWDRN
jgi:hypothetical protein